MGDVKDIDEAKQNRKPARKASAEGDDNESKPDQMSKVELYRQVGLKMDRILGASPAWPNFKRRFHLTVDDAGRKAFLEEGPAGVVRYIMPEVVRDEIYRYCRDDLVDVFEAQIDVQTADKARLSWAALTKPLKVKPQALLERSAPGLAFARLPFDLVVDPAGEMPDPPPAFERFLLRCDQPEELCAFLGSLADPQADRQQYLYLQGSGGDGKGSLTRFLFRLIPTACQFLQPRKSGDNFWNAKIFGKRIVIFAECEDPKFFGSADFRTLTGDDPVYIEEKGLMGFSAKPDCKFIIASNYPPSITGQRSDTRRIIYVQVRPVPEDEVEPNYEARLHAEAEQIFTFCKWHYLRLTGGRPGAPIPCRIPVELADAGDEDFVALFDQYFEAAEGHSTTACAMRDLLRKEGYRADQQVGRIKDCWLRRFGVRAGYARDADGKNIRVYWGCKLRGLLG